MKKITLLTLAAIVMTLLSCLPAMAQVQVTFTMSSSFYAGNAKLPAGTYSLNSMGDEQGVLVLQNSAGTHSVTLESRQSSKQSSSGKSEVLFNRYGTTEYLEGVATSDGTSVAFLPTKAETIAAKTAKAQPHSVPTK
ncbi:MAG: hypothetical protein WA869_27265 [Alloacidobacterium sp.]|jgi:hypothetical protein